MKNFAFRFVLPAVLMTSPMLYGQAAAAGASAAVAAAPHLTAAVPAVLTSAVSAGSARVGQGVLARLASASTLSDGTQLPAGTQLLGRITQAVPLSRGGGKSTLAMAFDRLKLPSGQERSLSTSVLQSIRGTRSGNVDAGTYSAENGGADVTAQSNTGARASSGVGGLLGGVGSAVGGVANGAGNAVGETVNGVAHATGSLAGMVVSTTGTLTAQGRNVSVPAGTQVSIAASVNASAE